MKQTKGTELEHWMVKRWSRFLPCIISYAFRYKGYEFTYDFAYKRKAGEADWRTAHAWIYPVAHGTGNSIGKARSIRELRHLINAWIKEKVA